MASFPLEFIPDASFSNPANILSSSLSLVVSEDKIRLPSNLAFSVSDFKWASSSWTRSLDCIHISPVPYHVTYITQREKPLPLLSRSASSLRASCVVVLCLCLAREPDHRHDGAACSESHIASSEFRFVSGLPQSTFSGNQSHFGDRHREAVELRRCWDRGEYAAGCQTFPNSSTYLLQDRVNQPSPQIYILSGKRKGRTIQC